MNIERKQHLPISGYKTFFKAMAQASTYCSTAGQSFKLKAFKSTRGL